MIVLNKILASLSLFIAAAGCASSQPLYATSVGGWPVSTWQARHGNVLRIECTPTDAAIPTNDALLSHGREQRVELAPVERARLVASHCERVAPAVRAPGAEPPPVALVYTPSAEQLWVMYGSHGAADRAVGHHVHSVHENPYGRHH